jgi:hypothetical protein
MLGSIERISSINKHISVMKERYILPVQLNRDNSPTALDNMKYVEYLSTLLLPDEENLCSDSVTPSLHLPLFSIFSSVVVSLCLIQSVK